MHSGKKFVLVTTLSSLIFGIATTAIASDSPATLAQTPQLEKPANEATVVEDNSFKFQLQGCKRTGKNVTCSLLITNLADQDRTVNLYTVYWGRRDSGTRGFDFSGNEYSALAVQVGKAQGESEGTQLLKGIPIKASVSFEMPRQVTQLAGIEITYYIGNYDITGTNNNESKIVFRDVPITLSK